jgi:predicted ATP-grasp superfamily ATP-dependent carboligase
VVSRGWPAGSVCRMDELTWDERPQLHAPALVAAFTGWNDAGDAASLAVRHIISVLGARRVAHIDPEEFFEFQATRPHVELVDGRTRRIVWPANELWAASTPGGDVVLLLGTEPQLRWRTFCRLVTDAAKDLGVGLVVTLGALLADVPHSRPVSILGTATNDELIQRYDLHRSRYEGPTGIVGVLHDRVAQVGLPSVSLWAAVPAYAPGTPSPKAALALVERTTGMIGVPITTGDLPDAAREYEREVSEVVSGDDDLVHYVERLESMADAGELEADPEDVDDVADVAETSGDQLVEEVERFLRDQGD